MFGRKLFHVRGEFCAEAFSGHLIERESDDGELLRKQTFLCQVAKRWQEFSFGQVAAGAKKHHDAGRSFLRHFSGA